MLHPYAAWSPRFLGLVTRHTLGRHVRSRRSERGKTWDPWERRVSRGIDNFRDDLLAALVWLFRFPDGILRLPHLRFAWAWMVSDGRLTNCLFSMVTCGSTHDSAGLHRRSSEEWNGWHKQKKKRISSTSKRFNKKTEE
ncbi:hypothetical protein VTH06DRAFT_7149 [Thermothelomyces fergusii]